MTILIIIIILALILLVVDIFDINRFIIAKYEISSDKINKDAKLVILADMHNKEYGKDNQRLVKAIEDINPDMIICAGDMLTAHPGESIIPPLTLLSQLNKYPIYYGIGNHEYRLKLYPEDYGNSYALYLEKLKKIGVTILENNRVDLPEYNIAIRGLLMDKKYYMRFEKNVMPNSYVADMTGPILSSKYEIMISHDPYYFDAYAASNIDLVLSGHVHGGIMKLPLLGGVISPRLELFPKYDGGLFEKNNSKLLLSRGIGCHTLPLRIFNPGELIVLSLKASKRDFE